MLYEKIVLGIQKKHLFEHSFEHPKHMFKGMNKKIIIILCSNS